MAGHKVKRLPVGGPDARLEGSMSCGDPLVASARDDVAIADAIQRGVIRRILMLEASDVPVAGGVVMPSGQVPNRSDAILLE